MGLLVYDYIDAPILYRSGDSAVLPVESLLACISVKTTVDKASIYEAARATGQLREMNRRYVGRDPAPGHRPAVFLFGFGGANLDTIREHVLDACENPASAKVLNGVVVLGNGLVLPSSTDGQLGRIDEVARYGVAHSTDGAFGIFVGVIWAALVQAGRAAPNLLSYMRMGEFLDPPYRTPGFEHRDSEFDEEPADE